MAQEAPTQEILDLCSDDDATTAERKPKRFKGEVSTCFSSPVVTARPGETVIRAPFETAVLFLEAQRSALKSHCCQRTIPIHNANSHQLSENRDSLAKLVTLKLSMAFESCFSCRKSGKIRGGGLLILA